jgi:hypothetical protein
LFAHDVGDIDDLTKAVMDGLTRWYNASPEEFAKWGGHRAQVKGEALDGIQDKEG